jgi:DNA-binding PadR family transcriptional regulator
MFKRDIDQFRFEKGSRRFMGQGPPDHNRPIHPPPSRGSPPLRMMPPFFGPSFRPPMSKESFQEIRDYMLLLIISNYPDGITGYQLQETYKFPRGTLIRTLQDLEEKNYLTIKEAIINGRANKFHVITEMGRHFLMELNKKWANLFGIMSEFNPSEGMETMMLNRIDEFKSKEEAIDFFRGIRSWMKQVSQRMEESTKRIKTSKANLDKIIIEIEKIDTFDKQHVKEIIVASIKKMKKSQKNEPENKIKI